MKMNRKGLLVCFVVVQMVLCSVAFGEVNDTIKSIKNWRTQNDTCHLNDMMAITIKTSKPDSFYNTIYVNGIPILSSVNFISNNKKNDSCNFEKVFLFQISTEFLDSLNKYGKGSRDESGYLKANISIGNNQQPCSTNSIFIILEQQQLIAKWLVYALLILVLLVLILLLWKYKASIIKDEENVYYSLGSTQLMYWSLLFVYAYLFICSVEGTLPYIPNSLLIILGISIGTTAASKLIDNSNASDAVNVIISNQKSQGFFIDILSDKNGINVHRFQNVVFNIVFGAIFIQKTIAEHRLPDFDNTVLILLGISSGSFAALKTTEPKPADKAVG